MIWPLAFEFSVYSRFDFVRMIWVLHNLIISEIINRYGVPGLFRSRICKRKNFAQTLSVSIHCNDQPKVLRLKISNPHKTTKRRFKLSGLLKTGSYPVLKMHVKGQNSRTCFSIIILFNLKNSVGIEWLKASWNSCHKLFKVSNYYGTTSNRRIAKTSQSAICSERPRVIIVISKGMTFVPFLTVRKNFSRYFQNRFSFKKF